MHVRDPCCPAGVNHLACCWAPGSAAGRACYHVNAQTVVHPVANPVARYAVAQGVPGLANTIGQAQVASNGDPLGVDCLTFPPLAQVCF